MASSIGSDSLFVNIFILIPIRILFSPIMAVKIVFIHIGYSLTTWPLFIFPFFPIPAVWALVSLIGWVFSGEYTSYSELKTEWDSRPDRAKRGLFVLYR